MVNMDFCDKHNMVAFLQKPTGSEEFHQILNFLAGSHIWYALTANLTIYVSLIEQFWQTATVKTVNDGEQQISITVDGQTIAITEASVRRHLQLANADGITFLPKTETFEQLTLMGALYKMKKAKMVIPDEEELVLEDPSKQGRMEETEYADVEEENAGVEYDFDLTEQQVTPLKALQFDQERKEADNIDWNKIVEQVQERQSGSMIRSDPYLKKNTGRLKKNIGSLSGLVYIKEAYQCFEICLRAFEEKHLDTLWSFVNEYTFRSVEPTKDMERALWVELKRLYEPDKEDTLFSLDLSRLATTLNRLERSIQIGINSSIRYTTTHGWWPIPRLLIKVARFRFVTISSV
ncbi:hypothetical protein Tco_1124486 [Tanacetum coccineum]|uniref:Uncharacterized protein n=1 Tax=Tanacetum coccineum TaxID=301880 RepID=A0ABQ5J6X8_9ASTR